MQMNDDDDDSFAKSQNLGLYTKSEEKIKYIFVSSTEWCPGSVEPNLA